VIRMARSPRERWGTCCPFDPECEHSFLDNDDLTRWMDTPLSDDEAEQFDGFADHSESGTTNNA
jgi:hypothetical protein